MPPNTPDASQHPADAEGAEFLAEFGLTPEDMRPRIHMDPSALTSDARAKIRRLARREFAPAESALEAMVRHLVLEIDAFRDHYATCLVEFAREGGERRPNEPQ